MHSRAWNLLLAACWLQRLSWANAATEHKVPYIQNIVLYPDKHSWCKTTEIKQIVAYPGCNSVEIDNSVCVGACFSYSIPKTLPSAPGEVITPHCDSCQPASFTWKEVKLTCHDESDEDGESVELTKRVQVISNCTCTSCAVSEESSLAESHRHSEKMKAEVPELMSLMMHHKGENEDEDDDDEKATTNAPSNQIKSEETSDSDNSIDEDNEIKKDSHHDGINVHKNDETGTHLAYGPHHSLVIVPDVIPIHHPHDPNFHHHKSNDDEEIPSLLQNQFKIHEHEDYIDQIAVESRKEYQGKSVETLALPELIYKEHAHAIKEAENEKDEEGQEEEDEEEDRRKNQTHQHHRHENGVDIPHDKDNHSHNKGKDDEKIADHHSHSNSHSHHHHHDIHKPVEVIEVAHHHLKSAIEGPAVSYVVKKEESKGN